MLTFEEFEQLKKDEQFKSMADAISEAESDDTPYVGVVDDEVHVIGNANRTELKKHDYELVFAFPNTDEIKRSLAREGLEIEKETENYLKVRRVYKGVYPTPRRASSIISAFTVLLSFFRTVGDYTEDEQTGEAHYEVRNLTDAEVIEMMRQLDKEVEDAIYSVLGAVFKLTETEQDAILLPSALYTIIQLVKNNPELVNESDLFFD